MLINSKILVERPEYQGHSSLSAISARIFHASRHLALGGGFLIRKGRRRSIAQPMSDRHQHNRSQVHAVTRIDDIRITAPNVELESFTDHLPKRCILFHYPETEQLAKSIAAASGSRVELGEIKWGCAAIWFKLNAWYAWADARTTCSFTRSLLSSEWSCTCSKVADGLPNVFVKDATRIRNRHVAFLASFQDPASIFEQLSVIYQLPRMFVGSFTLVLPYFPTGTAERVCSLPLVSL